MNKITKKELKKIVLLKIGGLALALGITCSDSFDINDNNTYIETKEVKEKKDSIIKIKFDDNRVVLNKLYSYDDYEHTTSVNIYTREHEDYQYLNKMSNLKNIFIYYGIDKSIFDKVNLKKIKNPLDVTIACKTNTISFNEKNFRFLKEISCIDTLTLFVDDNIDYDFLNSLKNVNNLNLIIDEYFNIRYDKLTNFKKIILNGYANNIAISLSKKEYDFLLSNGTLIETNEIDKLIFILNEIENIINNLNINENMKDIDKLNTILGYILGKCDYDLEAYKLIKANKEYLINYSKFYYKGFLTGVFDYSSQICGNYAALLNALCNNVGIESYFVRSENHAWNIIKIDDNYYYVDSTYLDDSFNIYYYDDLKNPVKINESAENIFKEGIQFKINQLDWYLKDPTEVYDKNHSLINNIYGVELKEIPDDLEYTKDKIYLKELNSIKKNVK